MSVRTYVESRKLGFFVAEQLLLFGAFLATALAVARGLGVNADWLRVLAEAACATAALQIGLYLADLYDFKVAYSDAPKAARLLKALANPQRLPLLRLHLLRVVGGEGHLLLRGAMASA